MRKHLIAALLAATTVAAGTAPAMANAQDMIMDRGPGRRPEGPRPEGPRPNRDNPGGPAGRVQRGEGRPVFHDREAFPENRPAFRPDQAPRPAPAPDQPRGDRGNWRGDDRRGPPWQDRPGQAPRPDARPAPPPPAPRWVDAQGRDQRWRDEDRRRRDERDRWQRSFGDWRDHDQQAYGFAERRAWAEQWNRGWRRDRRYDWMNWRSLNRGAYHLPRYYAPYRGDAYRRFSSGVILEPMFFGQSYWLDDPYAYRLPPAYGAYRWVRYYNDALLVDLRSGLVVDMVYDIFW